ncbi:hypothetical protein Acr_07g0002410 [Actinidia rufa]|uniref:Uncharacterized protein n=1 Tax=Actinidia rufa TaxID=165716 RepID=A0A7J0EU69_9ERIC|nr:hypothetical protein Acr_07g0002410 [Actinidia rufa]
MTLLLRAIKQVGRGCTSMVAKVGLPADHHDDSINGHKRDDRASWVPHPRTGIYIPAGNDRVMDDVPAGAASLVQTHWLRNIDGVDKPQAK